jgi:predicted anti-sigma-YlaC factor YlaD
MTHLTFEQISELAEGREPVSGHVRECEQCRQTLDRVRALIASAQALPREVAPPPDVWSSLRTRIGRAPARRRSGWRIASWVAAAAAIVLLVGTAIILPGTAGKAKGTKLGRQTPIASSPSPVVLVSVEASYSATLSELRRTLDAQRATLSPTTVRVVERSLATIDTAIAEARAALASDPANQSLVELLSTNYERKVELLQRATELSSSL